jgi:hypothetical protein
MDCSSGVLRLWWGRRAGLVGGAMTPARLDAAIEHCLRVLRVNGHAARKRDIAVFLGVSPRTLRRWLRGEQPIPRAVEIIMGQSPEATAGAVEALVWRRDAEKATRSVDNAT